MKYLLWFSFLLLSFVEYSGAQDLIVLNNGDSLNCMITSVDNKFVYFAYKNSDGNLMNVSIPKATLINFQREYYSKIQPTLAQETYDQKVLQNYIVLNPNHRIENIKGMLGYAIYYGTATVGLERELTKNSSIDVVFNGSFAPYTGSLFVMPGYRHYFHADTNRRVCGFFASGYGLYWGNFYSSYFPPRENVGQYLGLGEAIGNKFLLNKRQTLTLDLGFGIAIVTNIKTSLNPFIPIWVPRFIFNIGYRF